MTEWRYAKEAAWPKWPNDAEGGQSFRQALTRMNELRYTGVWRDLGKIKLAEPACM